MVPAFLADTWDYDGVNWSLLAPTTNPSARSDHAMVYDSARGRIVLFGGLDASFSYLADTWEYDGVNWVLRTPAISPPARAYHAMAYDSVRGQVVLFGGGSNVVGPLSE
ncbi:MAG: hypothetical protein KDC98_13010 [Planctomycetes bacterium]|nr:hypothetical protein [Planctomycetota bacterium]